MANTAPVERRWNFEDLTVPGLEHMTAIFKVMFNQIDDDSPILELTADQIELIRQSARGLVSYTDAEISLYYIYWRLLKKGETLPLILDEA